MNEVTTVSVSDLTLHPDNPRQGDVTSIVESINTNGWYGTIVAQRSTGFVLAGNHRLKAAQQIGISEVPVYWVDVDDKAARRILLADNRTAELATYDDEQLVELLTSVLEDDDLVGTGWTEDDIELLASAIEPVQGEGEYGEPTDPNATRTLEGLEDVSIDDPDFIPEMNTIWKMGDHLLIVTDMLKGWSLWTHLLEEDDLLIPYPGPYVALVAKPHTRLVMVQPDKYLAGHVLQKWNKSGKPIAEQVQQ